MPEDRRTYRKPRESLIPPGAKHLKGSRLSTLDALCSSRQTNLTETKIAAFHQLEHPNVFPFLLVFLVVSDWRILLKLYFQVFIVLYPADEAAACRVHEGAWGWVRRCEICGKKAADIDATDFALSSAIARKVDEGGLVPFEGCTAPSFPLRRPLYDGLKPTLILCGGLAHHPSNVVIDESNRATAPVDTVLHEICIEEMKQNR